MNLLQQTATLTHADAKKHLEIPFEMPAGATQLAITLEFSPLHKEGVKGRNMLCLTLFDPDGFRGAGHNKRDNNVSLSAVAATPGYTPGPLQAGGWRLVIDTHMVLPGSIVEYRLSIDISDQPVVGTPRHWAKPSITPRGAGWYRGDLHAHTIHSDASWDVTDLVKEAKERGLDFVTLSDHNTMSPLAEMDSLASDKLLTMGGMELTTYYGHALALGIRQWIDWRVRPGERTMVEIAADVVKAGGTFIIAHPMAPGDPECTGCDWRYFEMMPGTARLVEVWNGGEWSDYNERGLQLWYVWLNQGHHLTCTAGTDAHGPAALDAELGFNVVYAHELSEAGILAGIRAGRSYLSSGPVLSLLVKNEHGEEASLGESLAGEHFSVHCGWSQCAADDQIRLIGEGKVIATQNANDSGKSEWKLSEQELLWCLVEVRGADGRLRAVTNPVWLK